MSCSVWQNLVLLPTSRCWQTFDQFCLMCGPKPTEEYKIGPWKEKPCGLLVWAPWGNKANTSGMGFKYLLTGLCKGLLTLKKWTCPCPLPCSFNKGWKELWQKGTPAGLSLGCIAMGKLDGEKQRQQWASSPFPLIIEQPAFHFILKWKTVPASLNMYVP